METFDEFMFVSVAVLLVLTVWESKAIPRLWSVSHLIMGIGTLAFTFVQLLPEPLSEYWLGQTIYCCGFAAAMTGLNIWIWLFVKEVRRRFAGQTAHRATPHWLRSNPN